ncbi:Thioesterase [Fulvivirga imtechensis AK7]|uniref:Thioesterase n=1 Tax=Fulvivirga imtechensis AK7 TaxID=1237149 RepID=L8JN51_9BACT|nr:thioesterase domain-containing protein [Fulvivirga imtechensis]ELR68782.1 Thioesterase [Fulvivirga imtechensis AK7]
MKKIKLFCFPYAGGSARIYNEWKPYLHQSIELRPIELAGRGSRFGEPLYDSLEAAVDNLLEIIEEEILYNNYALFGHSMGALLSFELARKIQNLELPRPTHLFFSGKSSPDIKEDTDKTFHMMEDDEFKEEIMELGGTPPDFFTHPELLDLFFPLLRNDFKLAESNIVAHNNEPFDCDITVLLGKEDDVTSRQADGWKNHSKKNVTLHYYNGGHFFIHDEKEGIIRVVNKTLEDIMKENLRKLYTKGNGLR